MTPERLSPAMLELVYRSGFFPMGTPRGSVELFEPYRRALFPIAGMHVSRSFAKFLRNPHFPFTITFDKAFEEVMRGCLRPIDNWLNDEIIEAFVRCHQQGWAHSCEVWNQDRLVGGIYGVAIGSCFSAESMFHRETNASKVALWAMIQQCHHLGFSMFDAQIMNPHLESLGAYEIPQAQYLDQLASCAVHKTAWSA